jgi:coenzyme F420-reducing hydrogenase beta subunit
MLNITDKNLCTACGACASICPHDAIALVLDSEGFRYPKVDMKLCVDCGLCEKVCHMCRPRTAPQPFGGTVFAACLKDKDALEEVSSGGAAWALTQEMIHQGGVVYGAVQSGIFDTRHVRAERLEEAQLFRRSKYQESDMGTTYRQVKADLNSGRNVLFTGTGCQIGGLYAFLDKRPAGLITCDVVCHGIPSLRMFKEYIRTLEKEKRGKVVRIVYRDKSLGWKMNQIAIYLEDGRVMKEWCGSHAYHSSYLAGLISRPSCKGCRYQTLTRISDITLADFWQYQGELCPENAEYGISLVVCSTKAGRAFFNSALSLLDTEQVPIELAVKSSPHLTKPAPAHLFRNQFFSASSILGFMATYRPYEASKRIMNLLRYLIVKFGSKRR